MRSEGERVEDVERWVEGGRSEGEKRWRRWRMKKGEEEGRVRVLCHRVVQSDGISMDGVE